MNCDQAIRVALAALETTDEHQRRDALAFITHHPGCLMRFDQLTRALLSDLDHELTCAEAREQFFTYYERETQNADAATQLPHLHNHLQRCPYCHFDYLTMKTGILAHEEQLLPATVPSRPPAFSFLPPLPTPVALWQVRDQLRTFVEEISIRITHSLSAFDALRTGLVPTLTPATQLRNGETTASYAALILPDPDANLRFHIETATVDQSQVRVVLQIFDATTDKTVTGVRVNLRTAQRELLRGVLTDNEGKATFASLAPGKYLLQLRQQEVTWEVPIAIVAR